MARSKYGNRKVVLKGEEFDSMKEYQRWYVLKMLEKSGKIQDLQRQVKFVLIPAQYEPDTISPKGAVKRGKMLERECSYVADFVYTENGQQVVEDTKGFRTADYIIKRKLMLHVHGIRIKET